MFAMASAGRCCNALAPGSPDQPCQRWKIARLGHGSVCDMLVKSILLFLLGMVLIAMIGRALFPGSVRRLVLRRSATLKPGTCPRCGTYIIGKGPCACGAPTGKP